LVRAKGVVKGLVRRDKMIEVPLTEDDLIAPLLPAAR